MPKVTVVNVSKRYGDIVALDHVSLEVEDGEYVCIIGPSGSGKTTLLKIIAGILMPDEGDVLFDGVSVLGKPLEERGIGIVMQEVLLFPHMTVWENIAYSPLVKGLDPELVIRTSEEVVNYIALSMDKRMYPDELSRGAQQKVAVARALASGPKLLLLDEPFGSIDAETARRLRFELRRLVKDLGLTAIHITHNQEEALSIADKVVVMRKGRVEQVGRPIDLYLRPRTPFICRFIGGEANFFEGYVKSVHDGMAMIELKGGTLIKAMVRDGLSGRVVVSVKPEDVVITGSSGEGSLEARVVDVNFLGAYYRVLLDSPEGEIIVRTPRKSLNLRPGGLVKVSFNNVIVFSYPEEGLEKAIAYE